MSGPADLGHLSPDDWERLQDAADRFEEAWVAQGPAADLGQFLPSPDDPLRRPCLLELIKTDLELRWKAGRLAMLEHYVQRFPELGPIPSLPLMVVYEEWHVRQVYGDAPPLAAYQHRFPEQFAGLQELIDHSPTMTQQPPASPEYRAPAEGSVLPVGGGYKLVHRLGAGSFAEVWRAEAPGGIEVALKIINRPQDDQDTQRELEALELMKKLRHPFLLQTQAFWVLDDKLVIVTDLADESLRARQRARRGAGQGSIPVVELLGYVREAAEALDFLHSHGVQHRDVKPDNLLLVGQHAKLADFGLAKLLEKQRSASVSNSGTPLYMAPEVWRGKVLPASDQYSLASAYVEIRLDRPLFSGRDWLQVMLAHLGRAPNLEGLGPDEQQVLRKALAKDASARFASCVEFAEALAVAAKAQPAVLPVPFVPSAAVIALDESGTLALSGGETPAESDRHAQAPSEAPSEFGTLVVSAGKTPSEFVTAVQTANTDVPPTIEPAGWSQTLPAPMIPARWRSLPQRPALPHWLGGAALGVVVLGVVAALASRTADRPPRTEPPKHDQPAERDEDADELQYLDPSAPAIIAFRRGAELFNAKKYDEAAAAYTEALTLDSQFALAYKNRGNCHFRRKRLHDALADYTSALHLNPRFAKALANRGRIYTFFRDYDQAVRDLTAALAVEPHNADYLVHRGIAYRLGNKLDEALIDLNRAIERGQQTIPAYNNRALVYAARRDSNAALRDHDRAIALCPTFPFSHVSRGDTLRGHGDYARAIDAYTTALEHDAKYAPAYTGRGEAYRLLGQQEQARINFTEALKYDSQDDTARNGLIILSGAVKK